MGNSNFPKKVNDWMDIIDNNALTDPDRALECCDELEKYAFETRSDYLRGFCLFFRGYCYYGKAQLELSMDYLSSALNYLIHAKEWLMVARTYNAMGNIADFQGDISLAIDCYLKGLTLSKEKEIQVTQYNITSNIANIFIALHEPSNAVEMLLECEHLTDNGLEIPVRHKSVIHANLATCYVSLGELDKAASYLALLKEECGENPTAIDRISINIIETGLYHASGDFAARDAAITALDKLDLDDLSILDAFNELCEHAKLLLELDKCEEFLSLVNRLGALMDTPTVEKKLLGLLMQYSQKIGDEEEFAKLSKRYYVVAEKREDAHNKIVSHNIHTRMRLDDEAAKRREVEISNLMLKQKSERDALTGMNNRYKLNELSELAFHRAYVSGSPLTVEILDIDCFKEFNDNYGHQAGDECLVRIANAIRSMEEFNGVYTGRYGGDEFVIIYEDYTRKDVERMAQRLQDAVRSLNIEHKYSKVSNRVTISQGLFHKIPSGGNKPWDFLYGADMALYGVKNRSKNAYHVGTNFEEVRAYSKVES